MKGKLVVIDGSDASGKHTQVELLKKKLLSENKSVKTLDFPQYDSFFGKLISSYLNGEFGEINDLHPKIPALFFALDRFEHKNKILNWLDEGNIVILDRYIESNIAYQSAKFKDSSKKEKLIKWVKDLEYNQLGLPKADLVIYLHVPTSFSKELLKIRPDKEYIKDKRQDIHEKNTKFLDDVENNYLNIAKSMNWHTIECIKDNSLLKKEEIAKLVYNTTSKKLFS